MADAIVPASEGVQQNLLFFRSLRSLTVRELQDRIAWSGQSHYLALISRLLIRRPAGPMLSAMRPSRTGPGFGQDQEMFEPFVVAQLALLLWSQPWFFLFLLVPTLDEVWFPRAAMRPAPSEISAARMDSPIHREGQRISREPLQ